MAPHSLPANEARRVTVAVMPREKYCCSEVSLRSLLENTQVPFELLYIDAASPPEVQSAIGRLLADRPHSLHRTASYLAPFAANAVAIDQATTEYLVVVDNDVFFHRGWLQALLRCADEEQADVVTPLMLIGAHDSTEIHSAGGETSIVTEPDGRRRISHTQHFEHCQLDDPAVDLRRKPTQRVETHAVFARLDTWRSLGPLDPQVGHMTNVDELSLRLSEVGARVWFEPESRVVYLYSPEIRLARADIQLMSHAWSERWIARDLEAIHTKWELSPDDTAVGQVKGWFRDHRRLWLQPAQHRVERIFATLRIPVAGKLLWKMVKTTETVANRIVCRR